MPDLVMMKCEAMNVSLSTAGCARAFLKAQTGPQESWSPNSACRFCPIGAKNAGVSVNRMGKATAELGRFCPRCQRPAGRFIAGQLCVSCYNRGREAERRVDGRGKVPRFADAVHSEVVAVAEGDAVAVRVASSVMSRTEAMLAMAKKASAPMAFGRAPLALNDAMPLAAA